MDVVITEIGGTVGDIEGLPFLEAIRQFALDVGKQNCLYIHLTLIPYLKAAGEAKTKPTQHTVGQLRQIGIQPDILICRTEREIAKDEAEKIALFCNVEPRAVIEERDKEFSIYEVPLSLVDNKLDELIVEKLNLPAKPLDISDWRDMLLRMRTRRTRSTIAVVGKYIKHHDAYKSVYESLDHAGIAENTRVVVRKIEAEEIEREGAERVLSGVDGILVPGGFGYRGIAGKIDAIRFAREKKIPFFGICLGLHAPSSSSPATSWASRTPTAPSSTALPPTPSSACSTTSTPSPTRAARCGWGRLPDRAEGSPAQKAYGSQLIHERHRHRYEFNNQYRQQFVANGMAFSGLSPDGKLVEVVELPAHPWFVAVQCRWKRRRPCSGGLL